MISHFDQSIPLITWLQQFSPDLDSLFLFFTWFGDEMFYLVFLPALFWCLDRRVGVKLSIALFLSVYLNALAKFLADQPRPYEYSSLVKQLVETSGRGFPSHHTQNTIFLWGFLSFQFRQTWLWIISGIMMIFIPFSRLYLGVHFPVDLLGGLVLGILALFVTIWTLPHIEKLLEMLAMIPKILIAILLPSILMLILHDKISLTIMSTMLGFSTGVVLEQKWIQFEVSQLWKLNVIRYMVGMVGLLIIWLGLKFAFESLEPAWLFRVIRYSMCGLWVGLGAPWLFDRFVNIHETN